MNAIVVALIGMVILALGYRYYSKFVAEKIFKLDPNYETPAHKYEDGVDFVPTNKFVLWGHHFTSVAGAAPILGPDRKSTRLNSSHVATTYAVFCLKKKTR